MLYMTAGVRLTFERFKEVPGLFSHAEVWETVKQELRTHSISSVVTVFEYMSILNNLLFPDM